jgi:16S rRNA (guanine527-N7)-methyltransferase
MAPAARGEVLDPQIAVLSRLLRALDVPQSLISPLLAHAEAVRVDADRLGLVSGSDSNHILARHTADSLLFALARRPGPAERWVDVGSGAGFPGLVLACAFPRTVFTLVESQRRRGGFLELQCARLGISNVEVVVGRAEALPATFDVACARALADPNIAVALLNRLIVPGGLAIIAAGQRATQVIGAEVVEAGYPGVDSPGRFLVARKEIGGS